MIGVEQVCTPARVNKIDPAKVDEAQEKDILLLSDLSRLFDMLAAVDEMKKEITQLEFTSEANDIYIGAFGGTVDGNPLERTLSALNATITAIESLKGAKREALEQDRQNFKKMRVVVAKAQASFAEGEQNFSADNKVILDELLAAVAGPYGILEIPNYVRNTLQTLSLKLSGPTKKKIGVGQSGWVEKLAKADVEKVLSAACASIELEEEAGAGPKPGTKPQKKWHDNLSYSIRGGIGYGRVLSGGTDPLLLAGEDQGVLTFGAVSGRYLVADGLALQIDYSGNINISPDFKQTNLGTDDAAATVQYDSEKLDLHFQAGWLRYSNTTLDPELSALDPDLHGVSQDLRLVYTPIPLLSLHLNEVLFSGMMNGNWNTRVQGEPGLIFNVNDFHPFVGGIGGYDQYEGEPIYGGYAGVGMEIKEKHRINFRGDYTNLDGLGLQARYFYDDAVWGAGPLVAYNYNMTDKSHKVGGGLAGRFAFGQLFKKPNGLELQAFVQSMYAANPDIKAADIACGIVLRWNGLRLAQPSALTPYSIDSLPEGM
jgi:hypothetical protein